MYIGYYQFVPKDEVRGPLNSLSAIIFHTETDEFYVCKEIVGDQLWMVPGTVDPND